MMIFLVPGGPLMVQLQRLLSGYLLGKLGLKNVPDNPPILPPQSKKKQNIFTLRRSWIHYVHVPYNGWVNSMYYFRR